MEQELREGVGYYEHHGGKMEHFGLHYGAPKFWGGGVPPYSLALQAELAARAGKQLEGRGLKWAHDEPAEPRATPAPTPSRKAPKPSGSAAAAVAVSSGGLEGVGGMGGIEAAASRGTCEALGDLDVLSTGDIVSGVVAGLGKSRLNISRDIGEFSRTSLTSLREANASLKQELKAAHAEGDAKESRIANLETKLAQATSSAHDWHLKAKELETQLQYFEYTAQWFKKCRLPHTVVGVWNWLSGLLTPPPIFRVLNSFFYIPWAHGTPRCMCQNDCFGGVFLVCQVMLTTYVRVKRSSYTPHIIDNPALLCSA